LLPAAVAQLLVVLVFVNTKVMVELEEAQPVFPVYVPLMIAVTVLLELVVLKSQEEQVKPKQ
jgi:hypothetical protein